MSSCFSCRRRHQLHIVVRISRELITGLSSLLVPKCKCKCKCKWSNTPKLVIWLWMTFSQMSVCVFNELQQDCSYRRRTSRRFCLSDRVKCTTVRKTALETGLQKTWTEVPWRSLTRFWDVVRYLLGNRKRSYSTCIWRCVGGKLTRSGISPISLWCQKTRVSSYSHGFMLK